MHRAIASQSFQAPSDLQNIGDPWILARHLTEARLGFHRVVEADVQNVRHQFGNALDIRETHVQHPADVFDRRARASVLNVMICATCSRPYFSVTY